LVLRTEALARNKSNYFLMILLGSIVGIAALGVFNGFLFYIQSKRSSAEQNLRDTEERFALAIQGTNDGIFDWDLKTGEVFYSKQFFGMLGYDRESFIGTIENFTVLAHPDDLPRIWQYIESYLHRELTEYSNTFRMRHQDGHWVWINSRAKAIYMRLRQVLINLIGNAIKFTEKGKVTVSVAKEKRGKTQLIKIEVADTGIGIAPENFSLIFERFKQADSSVSRKYGGTGLGLPISRNLVQLMGGEISLSSVIGEGSTFVIEIPARPAKDVGDRKINKALSKKIGETMKISSGTPSKVLIAEDYEGNIVVLSYILDDIGCSYDVARTGVEALGYWKEKHYDLVLMDIQMPEMDGFTATSEIRKLELEKNLQRTPIIGMTAHALVGDKDKCIAAGMDSYLLVIVRENLHRFADFFQFHFGFLARCDALV